VDYWVQDSWPFDYGTNLFHLLLTTYYQSTTPLGATPLPYNVTQHRPRYILYILLIKFRSPQFSSQVHSFEHTINHSFDMTIPYPVLYFEHILCCCTLNISFCCCCLRYILSCRALFGTVVIAFQSIYRTHLKYKLTTSTLNSRWRHGHGRLRLPARLLLNQDPWMLKNRKH